MINDTHRIGAKSIRKCLVEPNVYQNPFEDVVCANINDIASRIFAACNGCQASDLKLSSVGQCLVSLWLGPPWPI